MSEERFRAPLLPWEAAPFEQRRFAVILGMCLMVGLLLSFTLPWLPLTEPERTTKRKVPERLVELVMEQQDKPIEKPEKKQEKETEEEKDEEEKKEEDKEQEKPDPEEQKPEQTPEPADKTQAARKVAEQKAKAFDALADLREQPETDKIKSQSLSASSEAADKPSEPKRDLLAQKALDGSSGGVQTAKASTPSSGGGSLESAETTKVKSESGEQAARDAAEAQAQRKQGEKPPRSTESIRKVFARHKGSLNRIYQRALRKKPTLQGRVVFKLTIAPSGSVKDIEVVSSELDDKRLELKLMARIQMMDFGKKDVAVWQDEWDLNFFPS